MSLLELAGAPAEVIQSVEAKASPEPDEAVCYVWEENWQSFQFYLMVQSQWVIVTGLTNSVRVKLDYAGIGSAMWMDGIHRRDRKALFSDLRLIESAVLEYDGEKKR
ncbi:DUF1799 domain-containing protein [Noviherbaspirillum saxi]|uniref:DUF1799 domain-containing protein n=1 Tax=Noviherbaspirillum saxi TaxID=2320863 RepID=UPI001313FD75|nr:DUF1799 domain-containing protein [Noviherbaspirillum saxi]